LCGEGGLIYTPAGSDGLQLQLPEGQNPPPTASCGPFRMRLTGMNYYRGLTLFGPGQGPGGASRSENLTVTADVLGEPHIHILRAGAMEATEATDDSDQSLAPASSTTSTSYSPNYAGKTSNLTQPLNASFNLKPGAKPSGTLKVLRGTIPIEVIA